MWNLKNEINTNELIYKTEIDSQSYSLVIYGSRGKRWRINWEFGIKIHTLLYIK